MIRGDNHLVLDNMRDDYPKLVQWTWDHGQPVSPRNQLTHELQAMTVTLLDPTDALPLGVGLRQLSLGLAASEALQLISGTRDSGLTVRIRPEFREENYDRVRAQISKAQKTLRADPSSRGAVVPEASRRVLSLQFLFRDSHLQLNVHARSMDVIENVHDFFSFSQLQISFANVLGVLPGPLHLHTGSLHMHARDLGTLDLLHTTDVVTRPTDLPLGFGRDANLWDEAAIRAQFVLDVASGRTITGVNPNAFNASEKWYLSNLRPYWIPQEETP